MTSSARNKSSEVSAIEYSTVRVPYDVLNKKFRHAQKIIDREISQLNSLISNIERLPSPELEEQAIKSLREKLGSFKKRYLDCLSKEGGYANKCSERLDYLQEYIDESDAKIESLWKKKRLNRILVDYFLRNSNYETAVQLVKATGIETQVDTEPFLAGREIEQSLAAHNTTPCLQWCYENRSRLKKSKVNLEFKLHTQNFIEKIRCGDYKGAIQYAQRYLVDGGEAPLKLQETMALLAFKPTTECEKYKRYFSEDRWEELVVEFRRTNYELHHLHTESLLSTVLQSGLSVIKTHQCYSSERSGDCPVCNEPLNALAAPLPFSHCTQSRLICRISGDVMNEHNHPLMLPNGHVYGERALTEMMETEGVIVCPRTEEVFWLDQCKKVYVM
eukprot:sb/3465543/